MHATKPENNAVWWTVKLDSNVERDARATRVLKEAGWEVIRVWEHEEAREAAALIAQRVAQRAGCTRRKGVT